ncbi:MAG: glycogen synthase [Clostridia bacterium BRH_c25]|nr:MAG: glycogen synthase [Clostridia bacterium BRH_c25]
MNNLNVLFAASEAVPFAKTGGLADVAGTLPKELISLGADVRLIMPKYKAISQSFVDRMEYIGYVYVDLAWRHQYCAVLKLEHEGVTAYFIDNEFYFNRDVLYGHFDEAEQFAFFSKAVLKVLPLVGFKPDIIHCNDWQTGILSVLLKAQFGHEEFYRNIRTVYTIHNLKYQGIFNKEILGDILGLGWEHFNSEGLEFHDNVNYMKAGIAYSDVITTVSKTYAEEIRHDFFGENLNGMINKRNDRLYGILNGIDYQENNPATDDRIFKSFDAEDIEGKYENKKMLQQTLGLPQDKDIPLISIVSRLVDQKGFDLIACVLEELLRLDMQLVVLGTGDKKYEEMFGNASSRYPGKVSANLKYDGLLAQRIYAGSDMFLMPSLYEPCGLSQLFSLRYGTVPIVRETGGLNDTIELYNEFTGEGTGFTFANYNAHEMLDAIRCAMSFYGQKDVWEAIIRNGMKQDFSWNKSAREYMELYERVLALRK